MSFLRKYEPTCFQDVVITDATAKKRIHKWIVSTSKDPLLLSGPPGTGKSSLAKTLASEMYPGFSEHDLKWIIADGRNHLAKRIEALTEFCETVPFSTTGNKFVVIDEIDNLVPPLQKSLKGHIDKFSQYVHFVFTTNYQSRVEDGLRSRCRQIQISHSSFGAWLPRMQWILKNEGYEGAVADADLLELASLSQGSCRNLLRHLEDLISEL